MTDKELFEISKEARLKAYAPYSGYRVGAALLGKSGRVYTGCNVENAAYTPTNCAERTAIFKAISEGEREFSAIAVCGGSADAPDDGCTPCGICRQVLREFCNEDFPIILKKGDGIIRVTLGELLPFSFSKASLVQQKERIGNENV